MVSILHHPPLPLSLLSARLYVRMYVLLCLRHTTLPGLTSSHEKMGCSLLTLLIAEINVLLHFDLQ